MRIRVNGRDEETDDSRFSVLDYLKRSRIRPETVAIELNERVLEKRNYGATYLKEADTMEIVRFVGGGA